MKDPILSILGEATKGLLYPSETDAPFEPFLWEAADISAASVARLSGNEADVPCRCTSLPEFLGDLIEDKEFQDLRATLEKTLTAIAVYRFGDIEPVYYLVGKDPAGRLAGLKTHAVET